MSIASEITRLQGVKSDILQAIADKGVAVPAGSALDDCPELISDISYIDSNKFTMKGSGVVNSDGNFLFYRTSSNNYWWDTQTFPLTTYTTMKERWYCTISAFTNSGSTAYGGWYCSRTSYTVLSKVSVYTDHINMYYGNPKQTYTVNYSIPVNSEFEIHHDLDSEGLTTKVIHNGQTVLEKRLSRNEIYIADDYFIVGGTATRDPNLGLKGSIDFMKSFIEADGNLIWGLDTSSIVRDA